MTNIPPCPFCGNEANFPEAKDVYGTYYEYECDCGLSQVSIDIIGCFDHPRKHVHNSWDDKKMQYGMEFIEVARNEAIILWSQRVNG